MHGGGGDRATGLGHDAGVLEQPGYGRGDVRLAHRHHFIQYFWTCANVMSPGRRFMRPSAMLAEESSVTG
jgi:hypothetical protein